MDNRNRHRKRLLAFILSAAMIITYMPPFMPAYAEVEPDNTPDKAVAEGIIEDKTPETPAAEAGETSSEGEQGAAGAGEASDAADPQTKEAAGSEEQTGKVASDADEPDAGQAAGDTAEETAKPVTLRANGSNYTVTVSCDADSGIPEGASLEVSELSGRQYDRYLEKTADALDTEADSMSYVKLLDISIAHDGQKIQPDREVKVSIQLKDTDLDSSREDVSIVHFGKKTEVLDADVNSSSNKVDFDTDGFSIYAITSQPATDLNGKTVAIVHVNTNAVGDTNNSRYVGRALQSTARGTTELKAQSVAVETHTSEKDLVTATASGVAEPDSTTEITEWTFESAGGTNTYYISTGEGASKKYLNISSGGLILSDTQQALTVTEGTGSHSGTVRISGANNLYIRSSVSVNGNNGNDPYFLAGTFHDNNCWLTLCEINKVEIGDVVFTGQKISVQDLADGNEVLIYQTLYNSATGKYEDFVIDHDGNLVKAYDNGDTLTLYGDEDAAPVWMLHVCTNSSGQPTGYYVFKNEKTGLVLHPLADGTLVAEYVSDDVDGVSLKGRETGGYTSTIEFWDESAHNYYGYHISGEAGNYELSTATGSGSQAFSFAKRISKTTGKLHEVDTVDSKANGVTIRMFNYPSRATISNVTGSDSYTLGVLPAQHASMTLTNGYPVFKNGTSSGSTLFSPDSSYYQGEGNHLFLADTYNSTGYYEYNAFHNFAHYDKDTGNFTVYAETGTPSPSSAQFYYKRGNFMPYNELDTTNSANRAQNLYNGDGVLLDYQDPSYGDTLYGLKSTDFYFGMTMEYDFMMPKDGIDKGNPLVYEFNGDDDLWIYIDDVLVLDIGGVHDAWSGTINFATGEIEGRGANGAKTIKDCFKNAGVFPDGTTWDDSKVSEYFNGNTFVDFGSHSFNMFYMEHGAGASNLETRFNLPVIEKGKVTVEKQLDNTSQVDYANVSFAYQAFKKNGAGHYEPLTEAVYEGKTDDEGNPVPVTFFDNVTIDGRIYNNVFYLKPREAAVFSDIAEDQEYYVQEIGIKSDYYDEIYVNGVKIDGESAEAKEGVYRSTDATARNRVRVTFTNHCDKRNANELIIKKRLADGSPYNGDVFEFRVMLENAEGTLVPYYQGGYYIRDDDGVYYKYDENNKLVPNGKTPYQMTSGTYGTINKIPPGYNVVIMDLLTGTDFYVDEIRVNDSSTLLKDSQWELVRTDVLEKGPSEISDASIYDYETGKTVPRSSLGSIAHRQDASVVFTNKMKTVDLEITKDLLDYVDHNSAGGNVTTTFVFRVTGTREGAAKPEYSTQVGIQLDSAGTKSKTLKNLPADLIYTVEEIYSGSSTVSPKGPRTLTADDMEVIKGRSTYKIKFENSGKDIEYGGGVINKYDGEKPMEKEGKTHSGSGQN